MPRSILCCTDGLPHSAPAIRLGAEIAAARSARLTILAVNHASAASGYPDILTWDEPQARLLLRQARLEAERLGARDVETLTRAARDVPASILAVADETGADLVVVGAGQTSAIGRLLFGSVARTVAEQARVSVLIARGEAAASG